MKKFSEIEKFVLAMTDEDNFNTYICSEHGIYQNRKDVDTKKCAYCQKEHEPLSNVSELKEKYKLELGI